MEGKRLRTLAIEIFKTINNINPKFMKNIFKPKINTKITTFDIIFNALNTTKFGSETLTAIYPKNVESILTKIKSKTSFLRFKEYVKTWFRLGCKQNACRSII